jgi:betaine-aldehyde dehydrogenase
MRDVSSQGSDVATVLPANRGLFYDGAWHEPRGGYLETFNPATGESLGKWANANAEDVDAAVRAAQRAFPAWRDAKPTERAARLRQAAAVVRAHADELALIDAANNGNPVSYLRSDVLAAAGMMEFYAGLATELKGETIPMGAGMVNLSLREPYGVVARIVAYNHPLLFVAVKMAPAVIAGNTVVMKPPVQAPLSAYRLMELLDGVFPAGVVNIITADREGGAALVEHPLVPRISLIGSVPTGRAIARAAADRLKHVTLELGGKNACVVFPDADLERAAKYAIDGMNFTWCGQSCGSLSRLFLHEDVHDEVLDRVLAHVRAYRPGLPTSPETSMGCLISQDQFDKVMSYIAIARDEGATLAYGGTRPTDPALSRGFFIEPAVFTNVTQDMRIAREEVFGPILSVLKWHDEATMLEHVNAVDYGLTAAIWTRDLATAHRVSAGIEAGYIWVNSAGAHFPGANYGGYKQSGIGREEGLEELLSFTQQKNVNISF